VDDATINDANNYYNSPGGCKDQVGMVSLLPFTLLTPIQILLCAKTGTNAACSTAQANCNGQVLSPLSGQWDVYYVLDPSTSTYPPDFTTWLNNQRTKIGAETTWSESSTPVYNNFFSTGSYGYPVRLIPHTNMSRGDRRLDEDQQAAP
jgi:hypothetical protein